MNRCLSVLGACVLAISSASCSGGSDGADDGGADDAMIGEDGGTPEIEPPPPPAWNPPIPLDPEVGWRESSDPLCSRYAGRPHGRGAGIWADERGVFVLASIVNDPFDLGAPMYADELSVHFNDGAGWELWHDLPGEPGAGGADQIAGLAGGPLFVWSGGCPLERLDGERMVRCAYAESAIGAAAYLAVEEWYLVITTPPSLIHVVGGLSTQVSSLTDAEAGGVSGLWADSSDVLLALRRGVLAGPAGGPLTPLPAPPTADELTAVAAHTIDDFWVATFGADLLHYDGSAWTSIETGLGEGLIALWLDEDVLYFAGYGGFGRYTVASGIEIIFEVPPDYRGSITAMTGNAERDEVYLAVIDPDFVPYACGAAMLIVYDGARLRRF